MQRISREPSQSRVRCGCWPVLRYTARHRCWQVWPESEPTEEPTPRKFPPVPSPCPPRVVSVWLSGGKITSTDSYRVEGEWDSFQASLLNQGWPLPPLPGDLCPPRAVMIRRDLTILFLDQFYLRWGELFSEWNFSELYVSEILSNTEGQVLVEMTCLSPRTVNSSAGRDHRSPPPHPWHNARCWMNVHGPHLSPFKEFQESKQAGEHVVGFLKFQVSFKASWEDKPHRRKTLVLMLGWRPSEHCSRWEAVGVESCGDVGTSPRGLRVTQQAGRCPWAALGWPGLSERFCHWVFSSIAPWVHATCLHCDLLLGNEWFYRKEKGTKWNSKPLTEDVLPVIFNGGMTLKMSGNFWLVTD